MGREQDLSHQLDLDRSTHRLEYRVAEAASFESMRARINDNKRKFKQVWNNILSSHVAGGCCILYMMEMNKNFNEKKNSQRLCWT